MLLLAAAPAAVEVRTRTNGGENGAWTRWEAAGGHLRDSGNWAAWGLGVEAQNLKTGRPAAGLSVLGSQFQFNRSTCGRIISAQRPDSRSNEKEERLGAMDVFWRAASG